ARPRRAEVKVLRIESAEVPGCEEVDEPERAGRQLDEALAERARAVEVAVARRIVDVAARVDRRTASRLPDPAETAGRGRIENPGLGEGPGVERHDPSVVGT